MNMDDLKTMPPSERDELNEHLDELRRSQRESAHKERRYKTSGAKKRSCLGCLIGTLVAIGGLFLFWRTACRPQVTCYYPILPDDDPYSKIEKDVRPTCYEIAIPDDNDIPDTESSPAELDPNPEPQPSVEDADASLEEVQQYYEKVKQESQNKGAVSNENQPE